MPSSPDAFRLLHRLELRPSFTSLGLKAELFTDASPDADASAFDAVMSGPSDTLWLFCGEDFLGYDLRSDKLSYPPTPIAQGWAGGALPAAFKVGVDSALWAGPDFPGIVSLFRGSEYLQLDCTRDPHNPGDWPITLPPHETFDSWLRLPSTDGVPKRGATLEPCAKLYGLREAANRVHFFTRDGRYARHNLMNGEYDVAPCETVSRFPLPPQFEGRVDHAFYGAGSEAEHIFFFSHDQYAQIDLRRGSVVRAGAIEQRFPILGAMLVRPQLYLVEDHALDTYVGPLSLGRLVNTLQVPPESRRQSVVETRVVTPAALSLRQNLLEKDSADAIADFYARLSRIQASNGVPADPAGVIWNGEVDALEGDADLGDRRAALVESAFAAIREQVRQSTHIVERQIIDATNPPQDNIGEVLNRETFELANTSDRTRQIEFMELVQQFLTLAVLRNVRLAYSNGRDGPKLFSLRDADAQLRDLLIEPEQSTAVIAYLKEQLGRIQDSSGDMRTFLIAGADLHVDARVQSAFVIDSVSPPQTIQTFGIIQSSRLWQQPTYQTRAIDIAERTSVQGAADELTAMSDMGIAPIADARAEMGPTP